MQEEGLTGINVPRRRIRRYRSMFAASAVPVCALALELTVVYAGREEHPKVTQLRGGADVPLGLLMAVTVLAYSALLVRRRRPLATYGGQWLYTTALAALLPQTYPIFGLLIGIHGVGRYCPRRLSVAALAAIGVPLGLNTWNADAGVLYALIAGAMSLACWGVGRHGLQAEARSRLQLRTRDEEAHKAIRAERLTLARDLHDILSNSVAAMLLQAAGARTLLRPEDTQVRQSLTLIEETGTQAIAELHRLLGLLRSDPIGPFAAHAPPDHPNVGALVEQFCGAGLHIEFYGYEHDQAELDPSVAITVHRVVHEALTNSLKHDGPGAQVVIRQLRKKDRMTIFIHSSPVRVPDSQLALSSGHGLQGLAERVSLVGGRLVAGPVSTGFRVSAELPLRGTLQSVSARTSRSGPP